MNVEDITTAVLGIIHDDSLTDSILDYINIGRGEIAREVDLPTLNTIDTVATVSTASSVSLPADYSKGLYWVGSAAQKTRVGARRDDYHNVMHLLEKYPALDQVGLIVEVAVDGGNLIYQGMADDTLTLRYYSAPTPLVNDNDIPSELPTHLHKALLVNFVCRELFAIIEDGLEGKTPNTDKYDMLFKRAMSILHGWADQQRPREPKYTRDVY